MLEKVKVTVTTTREDGSPICSLNPNPEPDVFLLTDDAPILVVRKDGGTVEIHSGGVASLLEFTLAALDQLDAAVRDALCDSYGLERSEGNP